MLKYKVRVVKKLQFSAVAWRPGRLLYVVSAHGATLGRRAKPECPHVMACRQQASTVWPTGWTASRCLGLTRRCCVLWRRKGTPHSERIDLIRLETFLVFEVTDKLEPAGPQLMRDQGLSKVELGTPSGIYE